MGKIKHRSSFYLLAFLLFMSDVIAMILAMALADLEHFSLSMLSQYYWMMAIVLVILAVKRTYTSRYDFWSDTKLVLYAYSISVLVVLSVLSLAATSKEYCPFTLLKFFALAVLITLFFKRILKHFLFSFDIFKVRIKVLATGDHAKLLAKELADNWYFGYKQSEKNYDIVLISSKMFDTATLQEKIYSYSKQTKDIYLIPYIDHLDFSHTTILDFSNIRLSALHIENRLLNKENILIKTLFEKTMVLILFIFALFLHLLLWLLIRMDSKGPVIFKQKRLGKHGRVFSCYKYRTMYVDNEELLQNYLQEHPEEIDHYEKYHKYKNDPRITRFGKFLRQTSFDEFPQFYNILRGDMNLIGPRPYMLSEKEKIGEKNIETILESKPGLTGLWQVSGRNELSFDARVKLDIWYIQNWSLWIDFVIFIKTLKVVFSKVGAR